MKKGDFLWGFILLVFVAILVVPFSREAFIEVTHTYPYMGGFLKFAILATMGDMLGSRVISGDWSIPRGVFWKATIWGIIGMAITLVFSIFSGGIIAAQAEGMLPFKGVTIGHAFFTSATMNITFAPSMFIFHKYTDIYIDTKYDKSGGKITLKEITEKIDWHTLVSFSMLKTIPFFWIPCHTLVFLLPGQYRVLASAFLSIALGLLLAIAKKSKKST